MLYEKHFSRLEKLRWRLDEDIDWNAINPALLSDRQVELITHICKTEIGSLYAAEAFLRDFYDDIDFSCFVSIWYYEEMKHFMVLKKYLMHLGVEIPTEELQPLRMTIPESTQESILMIHFLSEHKLAAWYQTMSDWLDEPVAKDMFKKIAADEIRHGQAYFDFIQRDIEIRPERLLRYLKTALFMLSPKAPSDMHAVTLTGTTDRLDEPGYVQFIQDTLVTEEKKEATVKRMYGLLSLLANTTVTSYADLSAHVKTLKREQRALEPKEAVAV